jgi:hypothetical protein
MRAIAALSQAACRSALSCASLLFHCSDQSAARKIYLWGIAVPG